MILYKGSDLTLVIQQENVTDVAIFTDREYFIRKTVQPDGKVYVETKELRRLNSGVIGYDAYQETDDENYSDKKLNKVGTYYTDYYYRDIDECGSTPISPNHVMKHLSIESEERIEGDLKLQQMFYGKSSEFIKHADELQKQTDANRTDINNIAKNLSDVSNNLATNIATVTQNLVSNITDVQNNLDSKIETVRKTADSGKQTADTAYLNAKYNRELIDNLTAKVGNDETTFNSDLNKETLERKAEDKKLADTLTDNLNTYKEATDKTIAENKSAFDSYKEANDKEKANITATLNTKADKDSMTYALDKKVDKTSYEEFKTNNSALIDTKANKVDVDNSIATLKENTKDELEKKVNNTDFNTYKEGNDKEIQAIKADIATKANSDNVTEELSKKVNVTDFNEFQTENTAVIDTKANKADVEKEFTSQKEETDSKLRTKVNTTDFDSFKADNQKALDTKANQDDVTSELAKKVDNTDFDTFKTDNTSAINKKADKTYTDNELAKKVDTTDFTTFKESNTSEINKKANSVDVYTKTETDSTFAKSVDVANTYATKEQLNTLIGTGDTTKVIDTFNEVKDFLNGYDNTNKLSTIVDAAKTAANDGAKESLKEAKEYTDSKVADKVTETEFTEFQNANQTELDKKANTVDVDAKLAEKVDNTDFASFKKENTDNIALKADKTELDKKADKATTLAGYGITDVKVDNGVITLGNSTIKPLTEHQSLADYAKTSEVDLKLTEKADKKTLDNYALVSELEKKADSTDIPTKVSQLDNDKEYITSKGLGDYVRTVDVNRELDTKANKEDVYTKTETDETNESQNQLIQKNATDINSVATNLENTSKNLQNAMVNVYQGLYGNITDVQNNLDSKIETVKTTADDAKKVADTAYKNDKYTRELVDKANADIADIQPIDIYKLSNYLDGNEEAL